MRILVMHGPNLNLLGTRRPDVYGEATLEDVNQAVRDAAPGHDIEVFQSNHEGELIDKLQQSQVDGALLNPGGFSHTSVALRDAVEAVSYPVVEVHLSNIHAREDFRRTSLISEVSVGVVCGFGIYSYTAGVTALLGILQ